MTATKGLISRDFLASVERISVAESADFPAGKEITGARRIAS
jgi:hypothetical protein